MKKTKTKCYLYTRVSTSMQVDGYSLDAQRDKLRKYAEYEDMVVAGEYSDEGFSGKNIQGRHEFQRMLQDIQDCKDGVEYVLVFKLSRFGRNAADVLNSLQLMQDFGVNLICVEDGIDSSKDSGKLMISVLSAVAEIERENIRTQTMAGREQKAREGKWNGGFAPYGYRLEKGELLIAEDEVDVIRTIFDRYIHTNDGVSGVAKYLNRQGFVKKLRQNGTIPGFSASFVKSIIDNPVYMGKIAYGRRRTEKKIGTRNEMHVVEQSEFPVYEGKHEAIISEEDWNLAQEKRKINAYRREKVNDPTHAHILSGILKCPCCGKSLYGNIAKAHSKDKKTRYYYYCKNTVTPTGHECTFRLNIEQMEMNRMVASIISAMVSDPRFADAIKAKIGSAVDTNDLEKQLEALQAQLRQTLGTKARLERQMDGLDVNDPYYDRKISDLQRRYDEQYGAIDEIEVQIDDVQSQIRSIRQEKISGDNIYRLLLAFDQVYEAASEVERKEFMRAFIERIELFPEKQPDGNWIRKIIFNFPVPVNGTEVKELPLENETIVESLNLHYGENHALKNVNMEIADHAITAFIGPSGCGKSTFLRCLNRMNDLVDGCRVEGKVILDGEDIYDKRVDTTLLRKKVGMVFQQPNPFPMSIYDNIAYGPRLHGIKNKKELDEIVERSLLGAAIFEEVKDRLHKSALGLSGGQQQRLCIARALAVSPEVLLMDEPTSALDPISTLKIEELMETLKKKYTVVIVTHNMQQAARVSDDTAFFLVGEVVEKNATSEIFARPQDKRTEDYITGRFG